MEEWEESKRVRNGCRIEGTKENGEGKRKVEVMRHKRKGNRQRIRDRKVEGKGRRGKRTTRRRGRDVAKGMSEIEDEKEGKGEWEERKE